MKRTEIENKVNEIISYKMGVNIDTIKPEMKFEEDLNGDSLDIIELIMEAEKVFSITIKNEDAEKCLTVKDMYDLVAKLI